ncbi:uncharacterized protein [Nicotiana sylvestris]|uniref:uncharacterized protein n=1 Tax=Nicotiana sylvestris TaxID=4096 RepID=UPI00388CB78E
MKAQALADHLAENPIDEEYEPLRTYFPDEEMMHIDELELTEKPGWKLFFDGAANMKGVGIGAVLISETGHHYPVTAQLRFYCTNNMVEYKACILGLRLAVDMDVQEVLVLGDSDHLVHQIPGEWETRDLKLIPYRQCLHDLCQRFRSMEFRHILRVHNEVADALATLASMLHHPDKAYVDPLHIQVRDQHAYCNVIEEEVDGEPWFHDIKEYIRMWIYPVQATRDQKRTIQRLTSGFFLSRGVLYKRTPDLGLLRCIDARETTTIMSEVHLGVCGPHMSGYVLAKKILRARYYWLTMERDCISFVSKCHQCQVHGDLIHCPSSELHTMSAPWPFIAWGMDVIVPIKTATSNRHRFILVTIDYFTKWVEAKTFKSVTKKEVVDFVYYNIICRFGIPKVTIIDNGANLNNNLMKKVCQQFKIIHRNSTPYHPKANGAVDAANKNIKKILRKMIVVEAEIDDDEWVKTRLKHLSLIDEKRLAAYVMVSYINE